MDRPRPLSARARAALVTCVTAALALALPSFVPTATAAPPASSGPPASFGAHHPVPLPPHGQRAVCGLPRQGAARCHAHVVTRPDSAAPLATSSWTSGYAPADLESAYGLPTDGGLPGTGPTVAIVDAYDNPNAEADLNAYRSGLGLGACGSGCFTKLNQRGDTTTMPAGDVNWGAEIDLDIEMVSAACPSCKILLVEADSNGFDDLMTAVRYAAAHADYVSNSYGGSEFSGETGYDANFTAAGVAFTVSSGDNGYGVEYPAASPNVTAVGGTSLSPASTARGWSETAWSGAGSGCSRYESNPSWQEDPGCPTGRTVADVSAVADPNTGVAVYDSYGSSGGANWYVYGGTSVAAPFVAGAWARASLVGTVGSSPETVWKNSGAWYDVTSGTNSRHCRSGYLCQAGDGYDGPTGWGTPNGAAGFLATGGGGGGSTNSPPTAAFTYTCTGLTCNFTDASTDPDGDTLSRSWAFGDRGTSTKTNPTHVYQGSGTYQVTLTVTDSADNTVQTSQSIDVRSISLSATGYKVKGRNTVDLSWTGASGPVDVHRDGSVFPNVEGTSFTDDTGEHGGATYSYKVCDAGTQTCSNTVPVTF